MSKLFLFSGVSYFKPESFLKRLDFMSHIQAYIIHQNDSAKHYAIDDGADELW